MLRVTIRSKDIRLQRQKNTFVNAWQEIDRDCVYTEHDEINDRNAKTKDMHDVID